MGYQFAHLETYSRKADPKGRNVDFVLSEAARNPEASIHVANPMQPTIVYGVEIEALRELHDNAAACAAIAVKGGKARKIRQDQKTLHTVVCSHPYTMEEVRADSAKMAEALEWERRTVEWLRSQYGDDLKSVIRHEDEAHFHLHAYVIPLDDPEFKAARFHPGVAAKREVTSLGATDGEDGKTLSKRADAAYKSAMRAWQDSYYEAVAVPCGLTRLGPARRRLSREGWQQEKTQAKALQKTIARAKTLKKSADSLIDRTQAEAARIIAEAKGQAAAAKQSAAAAVAAQDRAIKEQEAARLAMAEVQRYSGFAGKLRAIWDGLRKSKVAEKIRRELSSELERVHRAREAAERQLGAERRRRAKADSATSAMRRSISEVAQERDHARSQLQLDDEPVHPAPPFAPKFPSRHHGKSRR
ncbi:hypothetical protein [Rhizobium sullae]|uniref:hypothetical protein n=1 Tax=Rhizobium sullae TaxID=50338 RepID=UPI000B352313|nr:hypothetical protein [Rhizobium sullae]